VRQVDRRFRVELSLTRDRMTTFECRDGRGHDRSRREQGVASRTVRAGIRPRVLAESLTEERVSAVEIFRRQMYGDPP
jgi:hypothetical protein